MAIEPEAEPISHSAEHHALAVRRTPVSVPGGEPAVPPENVQRVLENAAVPSRDELAAHWRAVTDDALVYLATGR